MAGGEAGPSARGPSDTFLGPVDLTSPVTSLWVAWSPGVLGPRTLTIPGPQSTPGAISQIRYNSPLHMAQPGSQTMVICMVILPLGFAMNCTKHPFPTQTLEGSARMHGHFTFISSTGMLSLVDSARHHSASASHEVWPGWLAPQPPFCRGFSCPGSLQAHRSPVTW